MNAVIHSLANSPLKIALIAMTVSLAGCNGNLANSAFVVGSNAEPLPRSDAKGYVAITPDCILNPAREDRSASEGALTWLGQTAIAIADTAIPAVTSYFFDRAIARARAESLAHSASLTAFSNRQPAEVLFQFNDQAQPGLNVGCLVVVRSDVVDASAITASNRVLLERADARDWRASLWETIPPLEPYGTDQISGLYLEFGIEPIEALSGDVTEGSERVVGFYLRPRTVVFASTAAKQTSEANQKDLSIDVKLEGLVPTEKGGFSSQIVYQHEFVLEDIEIGTALSEDSPAVFGVVGPEVALPRSSFEVDDKRFVTPIPLFATVRVTESEIAGDVTRAVLDAIEAKKADIIAPVDTALTGLVSSALASGSDEETNE